MKMIKELAHLSYEEKLRELDLFSLEKKAHGDLVNACKHLHEGCKEDWSRLSSVVPSDSTRGSQHKLKHKRYHLNIRKHFFTGTSHPGTPPIESPPYRYSCGPSTGQPPLGVPTWAVRLNKIFPEIHFNYNQFMILWTNFSNLPKSLQRAGLAFSTPLFTLLLNIIAPEVCDH